jgi:hypothetical protein
VKQRLKFTSAEGMPIFQSWIKFLLQRRGTLLLYVYGVILQKQICLFLQKYTPGFPCIGAPWRACQMIDLPCVINVKYKLLKFTCTLDVFVYSKLDWMSWCKPIKVKV